MEDLLDSRGMIKVSKKNCVVRKNNKMKIKSFEDLSDEQLKECNKMFKSLKEEVYSDLKSKKRFKILKLDKSYFEDDFEFETSIKYRCFNLYMIEKHNLAYNSKYKGYVVEQLEYIDFALARANQKKTHSEMQEEWLKTNKPTICPSQTMYGILNNDLWTYKSKSYINDQMDYEKTVKNVQGVYDELCFESKKFNIQIRFKQARVITESRRKTSFQMVYSINQYNIDTKRFKMCGQIAQSKIPVLLKLFEYEIIPSERFGDELLTKEWKGQNTSVWDDFISAENWDDDIDYVKPVEVIKDVNVKVHTINPSMCDSILYGLNVDSINEIQKDINNNTTVFFGNRKEKENIFTPNVDLSHCGEEQKRIEKEKELWEEHRERIKSEMDRIRHENIQREYYGDIVKNSKPLPTPPPLMPFYARLYAVNTGGKLVKGVKINGDCIVVEDMNK